MLARLLATECQMSVEMYVMMKHLFDEKCSALLSVPLDVCGTFARCHDGNLWSQRYCRYNGSES